jgi:hypothetical protein
MKKIAAALIGIMLLAGPAWAEVRSQQICQAKLLGGSTTTDCAYTDISNFKFFSWQASCTAAGSISVSFDWVAGSGASSAFIGIPLNTSGTAMSQLRTTWTTKTTYTTLQSLQPPVSPIGTIRITENLGSSDTTCTVILNMGN